MSARHDEHHNHGATGRGSLRRQLTSAYRRSLRLVALGTALPGIGLIRARGGFFGWTVFGTFLLGGVAAAAFVLRRGVKDAGLYLISHPAALTILMVALAVGGILWCLSIVATAVSSRPARLDRARTRTLAIFTTIMVALVGSMTYKSAEFTLITKQTMADMFSAKGPSNTLASGAKIIVDEPDADPWRDTPRVNLLIIGADAGRGRTGARTDSMIVASIDTTTGRTVLIQLPRSLEKAPLAKDSPLRGRYPSGFYGVPNSTCAQGSHGCMLTNLWQEAEGYRKDHPKAYAGVESAGRTENRESIQLITGLTIDQEVVVNLAGFEQLIDAMGGVDITVKGGGYDGKRRIPIEGKSDGQGGVIGEKGWFKFGRQHMDGYHALWYARARAIDDDTHRQDRQRCVVRAIVDQVNPAQMLTKYADIATIAKNNIWTDISGPHLPAFVDLLERVQKSTMTSLPLTPTHKVFAGDPDYDLIRDLVQQAIKPPKPAPAPTTQAPDTATPAPSATPTGPAAPTTPAATTPTGTPTAEAGMDECE